MGSMSRTKSTDPLAAEGSFEVSAKAEKQTAKNRRIDRRRKGIFGVMGVVDRETKLLHASIGSQPHFNKAYYLERCPCYGMSVCGSCRSPFTFRVGFLAGAAFLVDAAPTQRGSTSNKVLGLRAHD